MHTTLSKFYYKLYIPINAVNWSTQKQYSRKNSNKMQHEFNKHLKHICISVYIKYNKQLNSAFKSFPVLVNHASIYFENILDYLIFFFYKNFFK